MTLQPPNTELLAWGSVMGTAELAAHERVEEVLEEAAASGALQPGTRGWKTAAEGLCASVLLGPARGVPNRTWLSLIVQERVGMWVELARPPQLREKRAALAEQVSVAAPPPAEQELEVALRPLTWLLEECRSGVTLTQSGYLPPALVRAALDLFGWWEDWPWRPRSEGEVHELGLLHATASRLRLLTKRGRRLATSQSGIGVLDDLVRLWRTLAPIVGCADDYTTMVSELLAHRLLRGPAEETDLAEAVVPVITAQRWYSRGSPIERGEIALSIHEPLRHWRLFRLLDEQRPRWEQGQQTVTWVIALTPVGRTTALAQLHARATGPRHDPFD